MRVLRRKSFLLIYPYNQTFKPNDEIQITIQTQGLYVLHHEKHFNVQGNIKKDISLDNLRGQNL